jgi:hypothetical protein
MALQRGSGWWLGPLVINYGLVTFGLVLPLLALGLLDVIPLKPAIAAAVGCGMLVPLLIYRWTWGLWFLAYYLVLPQEIPANNIDFDLLDNE